ncbi:MAG: SPOR domain-containing protein [Candidatus Saganbacteria bacterium]|nr:SPOR domain-containing protein [Candidatus Saganbacteria bacterium]
MGFFKKLLLIVFLIAIIGGSFWVSFLVGKQMLVPSNKLPSKLIPPQIKTDLVPSLSSGLSIEVTTSSSGKVSVSKPVKTKTVSTKIKPKIKQTKSGQYKVQAGVFKSYSNSKKQIANLKRKGFNAYSSKYGKYWYVYAGSYNSRSSANKLAASIKSAGFDAVVR